jgi:hypothetical protein
MGILETPRQAIWTPKNNTTPIFIPLTGPLDAMPPRGRVLTARLPGGVRKEASRIIYGTLFLDLLPTE